MVNKMELLKLAMDIYPCPDYLGFNVAPTLIGEWDGITHFTVFNSFYNVFPFRIHVRSWIINLCSFINIKPSEIAINYG